MFRPKNSQNPAHLVQFPEQEGLTYLEALASRAETLALAEDQEEVLRVSQWMMDQGITDNVAETAEELSSLVEVDDSLRNHLNLTGAVGPTVKAEKELVEQAESLDLQGWAENLGLKEL